ncbi:MAG: hypothetical protein HHJ11_07385 [Phycicoccus sp.]|nr:hypothetical protein [Phycicoccus sp.]
MSGSRGTRWAVERLTARLSRRSTVLASLALAGYLLPIIGPALGWPDAVMGVSPFWHLGAVPIEAFDLSSAVALAAIGAVCSPD